MKIYIYLNQYLLFNQICLHLNNMWVAILLFLAATLLTLAYLYGLFKPITTYKDKLISPHLIYYSFTGKSDQLSAQFDKIQKDASHFKLPPTLFRVYYTDPLEAVWECILGF